MRDAVKIGLGIIIGAFGSFTICALLVFGGGLLISLPPSAPASTVGAIPPSDTPTVTAPPSTYGTGEYVEHGDIRVAVTAYEFSESYQDEFGFEQAPPEGSKFLWIYVRVENIGQNAVDAPYASNFAIAYEGKQTDADIFIVDRPGYETYPGGQIFPGVAKEGWIRFTIPSAAKSEDIQVLFTPDSFFSSTYYVWVLAP